MLGIGYNVCRLGSYRDSDCSANVKHDGNELSPQSRRGVEYEVANGIKIPNLGQKQFTGYDEAGVEREVTAQVCDVNKALLSVSKMCRAGNKVVFGAPE